MGQERKDDESPAAIASLGWTYHHMGIPHGSPRAHEQYLEHLGMYVAGFETSPFGIEWMRFEPDSPVPQIVQTIPHVAFAVPNLDDALQGREVIIEPNAPAPGIRVAFIVDDGAPVELLEFSDPMPPGDG